MVDDPRIGARHMIERAKAAQQAGLDTLFVGDHHVTPFPYYQNNPMVGRMLAEWGDKPFGALYLLPLWHPVTLAEQIGTLAAIAPGRFIMQCGLGDHRQGDAMGIDMSRRVGMFEASLRVMRGLWNGESVSEDEFWNLKDAQISPVPAEKVDVWIGAVVPAAVDRAARLGDGWLAAPSLTEEEAADAISRYQEACAKVGRAPGDMAIRRDIYVGSSNEDARAVVAPYIEDGYRGLPSEALMYGSITEVADQMNVFAEQGYTQVSIRNLSKNQDEAIACIERLADVKAQLGG